MRNYLCMRHFYHAAVLAEYLTPGYQNPVMKKNIRRIVLNASLAILATCMLLHESRLFAQAAPAGRHIIVDLGHGERFYSEPGTSTGNTVAPVERVKYMTGELEKNAASLKARVSYQKTALTPKDLAKCDLLFVHLPSSKFSPEEVKAIHQYLQKGGSLFLVMDVDYWSTLAQTNVNDILSPYDIAFKNDNPDTQTSGGYTKPGAVTRKQLTIPYHGARIVEGGTPFCFSKKTQDHPFGVYKELKGGGKIIAMGDGMVSLYMTKWEEVDNYQCAEFMHDAFAWLLK